MMGWLLLTLPWAASAHGLVGSSARSLIAQPNASPMALEPYAQMLVDPSGRLTPDDLAFTDARDGFSPMNQPLALGFSEAVVWVKWQLSSAVAGEWWLRVEQPLLEDVRLYILTDKGGWDEQRGHPLTRNPHSGPESRQPTFAVFLQPERPALLLLRIQSRTSLATTFTLGSPNTLSAQNTRQSFVWGLLFGSYALVVLFYAVFALWTRERVYVLYTALIFINLAAALLTDAWNYELGLSLPATWQTTVLGAFISLAPLASLAFQAQYLETHQRWPKCTRAYLWLCAGASAFGLAATLLMHYRLAAIFIQSFSIAMALFNTGLAIFLSLKKDRRAQLLLVAFGIFHLCVGWRYLRNMGLITPSALNEHAYQIGAFLTMLILSTGIFSGYTRMRRESARQQARAAAESRLRHQQTQFLSLVAHEVKNPLAVIGATTDNLQITPGMPASALQRVEKIARNGDKIRDIFQSYLDTQQLLNGNLPLQFNTLALAPFLRSITADFESSHAQAIHLEANEDASVRADMALLSIAINNLLNNAAKYGGPDHAIRVRLKTQGEWVEISVIDQGPGIHPHDLPHLFDPYFRGRNAKPNQGSGLGLHLVRYIVERHDGGVSAHVNASGGMRFTITMPSMTA